VGAVGNIKQLLQDEADTKAAANKLKKEGRALNAIAEPTPEQAERLVAVFAELDALDDKQETIAANLVKARRLQHDERQAPTIVPGEDRSAAKAWGPTLHADATPEMKAEARLAALGEFAIAVKNATSGTGFDSRLTDPRSLSAAASGMGTSVPSDGGFAVPLEVASGIERDMFAAGDLLGRVDARTISGDAIAYNVIDETSRATGSRQGGVTAYWVDQGTAPTASQTKLARVEMKLRKVGALGYMTDELVSDAAALGGELQAMFGDELIFAVEDAITEGTGAGQPLGYIVAPCLVSVAKETGQAAGSIVAANISKMWARMSPRSKKTAIWLVNGDCGPQLDFLSIPAGAGALEPRFVNYNSEGILTIKGRPVIETEYNATLGTVGDFVLFDPKKYRLIRKGGVETASSIHVRFTQGEQTFRAFYRCDGQMMPRAALTPFKGGSNTLSPVVVLATRA
jgi:HK97 family phage major capsid protein